MSSKRKEGSLARGGCKFQVFDGEFHDTMRQFVIELRRLEIKLKLNAKFTCHPAEKIQISEADFWATTNDHENNRTINFSVDRRPENGELIDAEVEYYNILYNKLYAFTKKDIWVYIIYIYTHAPFFITGDLFYDRNFGLKGHKKGAWV